MQNLIKDLLHFHMICDVEEYWSLESVPPEIRELRFNLLLEEFEEYRKAEIENDEIWIADALADIVYIAIWTARVYWIPLDKVWAEVQRTNISKADPKTWKVKKRKDWKVLKPDDWSPPNIKDIINKHRNKKTKTNDK